WITSYEREENGRTRKYYSITESGKTALSEKESQWEKYTSAVSMVLKGGANLVRS
ncbi:MAG: helix-turn-helix transcriptional regulator, partial [Clostridia bacterium]|nr:helix-turn-helix transcriptional regulator [Clostridia bacterium]